MKKSMSKKERIYLMILVICLGIALIHSASASIITEYSYASCSDSVHQGANTCTNLFDHTSSSFWAGYPLSLPAYAIVQYSNQVRINKYLIMAYFTNMRNVQRWQILGSNDNSNWNLLDDRTSSDETWGNLTNIYMFSNDNSYYYYKWLITKTNDASEIDNSEWNLFNVLDAPVSNFEADNTSGYEPFTVHFTDLSTNNPSSWKWTFGDGDTAETRNATHTYNFGTWTVSLNVSNDAGFNKYTISNYINVDFPPTTEPTIEPTTTPPEGGVFSLLLGNLSVYEKGSNFIIWVYNKSVSNISSISIDGVSVNIPPDGYVIKDKLDSYSEHIIRIYDINGSFSSLVTRTDLNYYDLLAKFINEWKFSILALILMVISFWSPIFALIALAITGIDAKYSWGTYSMLHILVDAFFMIAEIMLFGFEL